MTIEGVDFANERPSGAALYAAGKRFVVRYLSPNTTNNPGKRLTAAEVKDYRAAGLDIAVVWETTTSRARAGKTAGVSDARDAATVARSLGMPADQVIYFAVDEDTTGQATADYFRGAASVLSSSRTGVYGSYQVVKYLMANKIVGFGWQTYAWSSGQWYAPAQLQQYRNGVKVAGESLDLCRATVAEFGQWVAPSKPQPTTQEEDMPLTQADANLVVDTLLARTLGRSGPKVDVALQSGYNNTVALLAGQDPAKLVAALKAAGLEVDVDPATLQTAFIGALKELADAPAAS